MAVKKFSDYIIDFPRSATQDLRDSSVKKNLASGEAQSRFTAIAPCTRIKTVNAIAFIASTQ
jgi:3-polyprenyl-4-hydroxybenzoate decarboxylase